MQPGLSSPTMPANGYMGGISDQLNKWEDAFHSSFLGRVFRLEGSGHPKSNPNSRLFTEIKAGLTTFATMAYIIAVNASIVADSGGTCVCNATDGDPLCTSNREYLLCKTEIKRDIITATAAVAGLSTIAMGLLTNLPVALAPGMCLNAYFTYQVVGFHGSGKISYRVALTAVFFEGLIFVLLALTGMRQWLVKAIPTTIKTASGVGIGFFLTEIGLSYSAGIGAITGGTATPLAIGGCRPSQINEKTGVCDSGIMTNPTLWLGLCIGGLFTAYLMAYRIKTAIVIGISLVSILSWPRNTSVTYFPYTDEGDERFNFFKQVVAFHPIGRTLAVQDWKFADVDAGQFFLALFTFLYVDIIDCTATLYSMARFCGVVDPNEGDFPRSTIAYCVDALGTSIGSLFGTSPVTAFIESGAGIAQGGRTGITAIVTGFCFLLSIFFAPIFASIPPWATGCTLILVGCLMIRQVTAVNWNYIGDSIPSFVAIFFIPFSFSVAYGLISALFVYAVLNTMIWLTTLASGGRIKPAEYDLKQYWTWRPGGRQPWVVRMVKNRGRFWGHPHALGGVELRDHDITSISHSRETSSDEKSRSNIAAPEQVVLAR